jgi:hypothetical protein
VGLGSLTLLEVQVGDQEVPVELLEDGRVGVNLQLQVLAELLEHVLEGLELNVVAGSEHLNSDSFVDGKDLLDSGAAEPGHHSSDLFELALFKVDLAVFHEVLVQDFLSLLLSETEALVPPSVVRKHLKCLHGLHPANVSRVDAFVSLLLLDHVHKSSLQLLRSDLVGAVKSLAVLLALHKALDGLLVVAYLLEHLSSGVELLDLHESLADNRDNFLHSVILEPESHVESILIDLYQLVRVGEVEILDLKVPVDGLVVVALSLKQLG